jgi:hypothetical protein
MAPEQGAWTDVRPDGVIMLSRLLPGRKTLELQASAADGRLGPALKIELEQLPHWYQRAGWWLAIALGIVALAGLVTRRRTAALRARAARLEALVQQRGNELAEEQRRLIEIDGARREAERELRWRRLDAAQREWNGVDPTARLVFAALARKNEHVLDSMELERAITAGAPAAGRFAAGEIDGALARLERAAAVARASAGWRVAKPDWLELPDLQLDLETLALANARVIGRYRLLERIGAGGSAEVFRAVDVGDGTSAAVKLLHPEVGAHADAEHRLRREAEIAAAVSHPNLIRLLDHGEHAGRRYLAMELIEGETLGAILSRGERRVALRAASIVGDVAEALAALHARGVVHRDVNPSNVMIEHGSQRTVLLDLGLARGAQHRSALTRPQTILGTLPYMAPEQLRGETCSDAADVFSLGVILFECIVGRRPWRHDDTIEIALEIGRWDGAADLSAIADAGLRELAASMLAPDAGARPEAAEVARAMRSARVA